ncbi:hypothetical protein D3C72_2334660 [compost metagenome]
MGGGLAVQRGGGVVGEAALVDGAGDRAHVVHHAVDADLQRDRHALLHQQVGLEARVLIHLVDHAIDGHVGALGPVARVGAVGQQVEQ